MGKRQIINNELPRFKSKLGKTLKISKMILFGSYARGDYKKDSDIDLLIVSPKFRGHKSYKRSRDLYILWHINLNMNYPVDFICYTPEEFEKLKKRVSIVSEALKEGIEIN